MNTFILAIDQGTTSSRAIIFNRDGKPIHQHQIKLTQYFPQPDRVEQDPDEIWRSTLACCRKVIVDASLRPADIAAIGITNQRETTIIWERKTGHPIARAIVWQDRRTADHCKALAAKGLNKMVNEKTGLLIDPYFSATKIQWLLDHIEGAREKALKGELAFGTIDTYLLWQLTNGKEHATDATNASRTMLFNIHTQTWDDELLALFNIPKSLLPVVKDSAANFGQTDATILGQEIPITGIAGDQQASLIGENCFQPGMAKSTYGTGCFILVNTGDKPIISQNRLLTTIAYRLKGQVTYGLEGSLFIAGAGMKWLEDLHLIENPQQADKMAASIESTEGVYLIPAFNGLGAPYWDPHARGAILGLTRDTKPAHIVRAMLEAVCYQTKDLFEAMKQDGITLSAPLQVDGGLANSDWTMQFLADMLNLPIQRPPSVETTALGAAYLAGLGAGLYDSLSEINQSSLKQLFSPQMALEKQKNLYAGWKAALQKILS